MSEMSLRLAEWWLRGILGGAAVLLLGWLLLRAMRKPAARERVGAWTVRAALLMPILALLPGWLTVPSPWPAPGVPFDDCPSDRPAARAGANWAEVVRADPTPADIDIEPVFFQPIASEQTPPPPAPVAPAGPATPAWVWLLRAAAGGYAILLIVGLTRIALGHVALRRLYRESAEVPAALREELDDDYPEVRVSRRVGGPMCFGLVRPVVMLPDSLLADDARPALRWVLAHEADHVRRGDPWTNWWLKLAEAVYGFAPWVRPLRRDVRLAQEHLADGAAVGHRDATPADVLDYADFLIRLSRRLGGAPHALPGAAGVKAASSELFRRVSMLLEGSRPARVSRAWSVAVAAGFLALSAGVAGLTVRADEPKKDALKKAEVEVIVAPAAPGAPADPNKPAVFFLRKFAEGGAEQESAAVAGIAELKKRLKGTPNADEVIKQLEAVEKQLQDVQKQLAAQPRIARLQALAAQPAVPPVAVPVQQFDFQVVPFAQGGGFGAGQNPFAARAAGDGRLGVRIEKPPVVLMEQLDLPVGQGMVVVEVTADSAAAKAGIKANDIILEVAGKPVPNDPADFARHVRDIKADEAIDVVVMRKGRKETIKGVKLPEAPKGDVLRLNPRLELRNPNVIPFPAIPVPPLPPGGGGDQESSQLQVQNNEFTAKYTKNKVTVTVTGKIEGNKSTVSSIEIEDGEKKIKAADVKNVPAEYEDVVKRALQSVPNR